jgi:hypothetical protein
LPGATPVKKFTDHKKAVTRIWTAIQNLAGSVPPAEAAEVVVAQAPGEVAGSATESVGETVVPAASDEASAGSIETPAVATPVAPQTPDVAPSQAPAKKKATPAKKAPKAPKQPAAAKPAREGSKTETIIALMKQPGGATLQAIMEASGWQPHSVRGFVSGTLGKKMGLTVVSTKRADGERVYTLSA